MFGSLVVVMPTAHVGGALLLRRGSKETVFDYGKTLDVMQPQVGFIAFYSDVEHEVLPIESGYRVTLTYNLYFDDYSLPRHSLESLTITPLITTLSKYLDNPKFLPDGGFLGFGLKHEYSVTPDSSLLRVESSLKGADAAVQRVAEKLSLKLAVQATYEADEMTWIFHRTLPEFHDYMQEDVNDLLEEHDGIPLDGDQAPSIDWITARSSNPLESTYISYGNEATLDEFYGHANLLLVIGKAGDRSSGKVYTDDKRGFKLEGGRIFKFSE
jgi:hypothetical protein